MSDDDKPMTVTEMERIASAFGAVFSPFATQQAETQRKNIEAQMAQDRMVIEERREGSTRAFWLAMIALVLAGGVTIGFLVVGREDLAFQALGMMMSFAGGYGLGKVKRASE